MSEAVGGCWQPGTVWSGYPLLTARLKLRPFTPADQPAMVALLNDWDTVRHTCHIPHPFGDDDAQAFIAKAEARRHARQGVALAMERTADGALVGGIGFGLEHHAFNRTHDATARDGKRSDQEGDGTPELGYWIGKPFWGQGLAAEAVRRLTRHLFQDLQATRVWAETHPDNKASGRVLEKTGFAVTGHAQTCMPARGQSVVMPVWSLERDRWVAAHAARPMVLVVAAALVDADGRVLMASRPPGKSMAGLWEFPGGKIDAGETPETALVRELAEELGIDVSESCLAPIGFASHDYDTFHLLMPLYVVRQWKGTVTPREGQSLRWVRSGAMRALPMPPADIPLVALLAEWV